MLDRRSGHRKFVDDAGIGTASKFGCENSILPAWESGDAEETSGGGHSTKNKEPCRNMGMFLLGLSGVSCGGSTSVARGDPFAGGERFIALRFAEMEAFSTKRRKLWSKGNVDLRDLREVTA